MKLVKHKKMRTFRFSTDIDEYLDYLKKEGYKIGPSLEAIVREFEGFKEWKEKNEN